MTAPEEQPTESSVLHLRDYLLVLRRRWWIVLLTMTLLVFTILAISLAQTPLYDATAEVLIQQRPSAQSITASNSFGNDQARTVETEVRVLESRAVERAATRALGHEPDIGISSEPTSDVVTVTAESTQPRQAARDATVYARAYLKFRREATVEELVQAGKQVSQQLADIDTRLAALSDESPERFGLQDQRAFLAEQQDRLEVASNLQQVGGATLLAAADVPDSASSPNTARDLAIALALSLLLGVGLAFLVDYLDDKIRSKEALERATRGLPILGEIPLVAGWRRRDAFLISLDDPNSAAAEAYRTLRTSIQFLGVSRELHTLQVTSAHAEEGKTTTIANLAVALARLGKNVLVVCCDLRRPRVHEFFNLENDVGFTSILLGDTTIARALQGVKGQPNLALLASGPPPPNPSELLSSPKADQTLRTLQRARDIDLILVDSPPVLPVADALVVAGLVDATVLVTSTRRSSRRAVQRAVEMLQHVDAPLVGAVLNGVSASDSYGYGYGYGYGPDEPTTQAPSAERATSKASAKNTENGDEITEVIKVPGFRSRSRS